MKYVSIFSVTLKSAMTPSFIGLMATTLPGVRPSISLASRPTATTSPVALLMATIKGIVVNEPSIVAINKATGEGVAVGRGAQEMLGRTPGNVVGIKPMENVVKADFQTT